MIVNVRMILLLLALVFFVLAALNVTVPRGVNLTAAGLALLVLSMLLVGTV